MSPAARPYEGRPVVVTGGAAGIGEAVVRVLVVRGYSVIVCDRDVGRGTGLVRELSAATEATVEFVSFDASSEESWIELTHRLAGSCGAAGLVNNAGVGGADDVLTETLDGWYRVLSVNQTGVFLGMKYCGKVIEESGGGSVVNLASIFSSGGGFGNAIAYHASKGAVAAMTKSAATMWATRGVRVNSVHPGFIGTPMTLVHQDLQIDDQGHTVGETITTRTPMRRLGRPGEVAEVVEFLISARASYVTGGEYYVDGGWAAV